MSVRAILLVVLCFGVLWSGPCQGQKCETNEIIKCLPAFGGERDQFPDTAHKLDEYCKQLMSGLQCAKELINSCTSVEEQILYHNLTREMVGMNAELCTPGSRLNSKFLKHVGCFRELSDRFKGCSERYIGNIVAVHGLTAEEQVKMTCCTVHEYNRCMRNVVDGRCDREAQELVQETVLTTLTSSFRYCDQLGDIPTSNCMRMFTETDERETGSLDGNGLAKLSPSLAVFILALLFLAFARRAGDAAMASSEARNDYNPA